ncbi:pentapeptide repeat-containing protein [Streptomyces sp. NPDC059904]|uniref:pentapeptide repeat-containing protein n=1 Tax=Streptomyces sp. NPDC059904 TaxID=3346996 RepID=UPI003667FBE1
MRLAAQDILHKHLRNGNGYPEDYWRGIYLNLSGAELIRFSLQECKVPLVNFEGARFIGGAGFWNAEFSSLATFIGATFQGISNFRDSQFKLGANFEGAVFQGSVDFEGVTFEDMTVFDGAAFDNDVSFAGSKFADLADFRSVNFSAAAHFNEATIRESRFQNAEFRGYAVFDSAQFDVEPEFDGATASHPNADHIWPGRWRTEPPGSDGASPLVNWE